ncbi:cell division control protein 6 homolog [Thalassophryne amazonica]|uniref:cell division control protein 6 homolog n=1 Tax=Thalassophryne amazonica TaxID=390379 RepID=UPI00147231B4|nr:cell division control protein 6 homolog [Thalassophryne amazonica]
MPSTRSRGQAQPTLPFPRRKSCRVASRSKTPLLEKTGTSAVTSPVKSHSPLSATTRIQPLSPRRPTDRAAPLSPCRPTASDRATPLSPRRPTDRAMPLSPRRPTASDRATPLSPRRPTASDQATPLSPRRPTDRATPLSPRRPTAADQAPPLFPRCQDAGASLFSLPLRVPLSPHKRTSDDNGCNLLGSPPKQSRSAPAALWKKGADENSPSPRPSMSPRSKSDRKEAFAGSPMGQTWEKRPPIARLFAEKSRYHSLKRALHTAAPERLLSREAERAFIRSFLEDGVLRALAGSLYMSGAPGTGKTACLNCVLQEMKDELAAVQTVLVNCMSLRRSHAIFPLLADRLRAPGGQSGLRRFLTGPGPTLLLVLDEMDQLDSKAQDVLYTIFEWPYLPKSRLHLIGIANALDLTDRILPRLQARPSCRPLLLNFPPYSRQELTAIVQDRLSEASAEGILDSAAVQFCARKVSAVSGDARKALDICRRAVEMVESDDRQKVADSEVEVKASRVGVPQVARVLSEVYGDRMASPSGAGGEIFPLQQKLLVCCLLLLVQNGKSKEVVLGKLHDVYSRLCAQRQVGGVSQGECLSLCTLLESRGIFSLKKAKDARLTKVFLKIEERDVENALKDRTLLGNILSAGLP